MRTNKILLISLFLLVITSLGAVSATDSDNDAVSVADDSDSTVASVADDIQSSPTPEPATTKDKAKPETPKQAPKDNDVLSGDEDLTGFDIETQSGYEVDYGDDIVFQIRLQGNATGNVNVNFNGQNYDVALNSAELYGEVGDEEEGNQKVSSATYRFGRLVINSANLNLGKYIAVATYSGDSIYKSKTTSYDIELVPKIEIPLVCSFGEKESIRITAPKGTNGNAILYKKDYDTNTYVPITSVSINDGSAIISLETLPKNFYDIKVECIIGSEHYIESRGLTIRDNTPGISATITPTTTTEGNAITLTFSGATSKYDTFDIYIDGKLYKTIATTTSQIKETISGLSVGKHKIKVVYEAWDYYFYSNTFEVTVNAKPTTTKVALSLSGPKKVSKKAKKLVLKATLKINKKVAKSKKVTFVVNGKKYTAKTNKKGIATLKINKAKLKKILKKVKVGKKIKYQIKYSYKVNKKTKTAKKTKTLKVTK